MRLFFKLTHYPCFHIVVLYSLLTGRKQMPFTNLGLSRLLSSCILMVSLLCFLGSSALAQNGTTSIQAQTPIVTATAGHQRVRYSALGEVNETRLQVFSVDGAQVYDSSFKLGNLID